VSEPTNDVARALVALRRARARIEELESRGPEPIALIGRACRFRGVDDPEAFAALVREGRDTFADVPLSRYEGILPSDTRALSHGAMIEDLSAFDPEAFGIPVAEAVSMDPQQRLLLEVCSEASQRAALSASLLSTAKVGVYAGVCNNDYVQRLMHRDPELNDVYALTGNALSVASGRIAYALGLRGPAMTLDTACSSSLLAVHLACAGLRARECDLAIAAGVSVVLLASVSAAFDRLGVLSRRGVCRPFDVEADGYVRAEGAAAVMLKRLSDAVADGDPILAVVRGSAVNQNGRGNGLIAPNRVAQIDVIRAALDAARVEAREVGFVEAMGTATSMGDLVETAALGAVYGGPREVPLPIGSCKANIGHCEGAAGLASLLRAAVAIQEGIIPPAAGMSAPNPLIPWTELGLELPRTVRSWTGPRLAAVSAFGFSGTNVHLILGPPPTPTPPSEAAPAQRRLAETLTLSASTEARLRGWAARLAPRVGQGPLEGMVAALSRSGEGAIWAQVRCGSADVLATDLRALAGGQIETRPGTPAPGASPTDTLALARARGVTLAELPPRPFLRAAHWTEVTPSVEPAPTPLRPEPPTLSADPLGQILEQLGEVLGVPASEIDPSTPLASLGLDSMASLELLRRLQASTGLALRPSDLYMARDLHEIVQRLHDATPEEAPAARLLRVVQDACPPDPSPRPTAHRPSGGATLLTGATGFLGPYLLAEILDRCVGPVYVLVRAEDEQRGAARLRDGLQKVGRWREGYAARLCPVPGDLGARQLGLQRPIWSMLSHEVSLVVHSGAIVQFLAPYDLLSAVNVGGTAEVLELCHAGRAKHLLHVSTKGVYTPASYPEDDLVSERSPPRAPLEALNGYQESKWVAEQRVIAAAAEGLSAAWVHVGHIGGDRASGRAPLEDLAVRFLLSCAEEGVMPDLPGSFEALSVDTVAATLARLAVEGERGGFHLVHPEPLALPVVGDLWGELGIPVRLLDYGAWRDHIHARAREGLGALRPLRSLLPPGALRRVDDRRLQPRRLLTMDPGFAPDPLRQELRRTLRYLHQIGAAAPHADRLAPTAVDGA